MQNNEKSQEPVVRRGGAGNFANDRARAAEAGRKGGQASGSRTKR